MPLLAMKAPTIVVKGEGGFAEAGQGMRARTARSDNHKADLGVLGDAVVHLIVAAVVVEMSLVPAIGPDPSSLMAMIRGSLFRILTMVQRIRSVIFLYQVEGAAARCTVAPE